MKTKKINHHIQEEAIPCFECEAGTLKLTERDYSANLPGGGHLVVPDVPMHACDQCGDVLLGDEGNQRIEAFLNKALNVISPEEIEEFLRKYELTQKQASQITGYGEKNISRWLTGRSRPSESVSNFFRLILADDEAFERLRQKNFHPTETPSFPTKECQPDAQEKEILKLVDFRVLKQMGIVDGTQSPKEKRTQLCAWARCRDLPEFEDVMGQRFGQMAAFKDSDQQFNKVSAGLWASIGERRATQIETASYHRDKLRKAVKQLRELTQHHLEDVIGDVCRILAKAGVALVFVPIMKQSALRGSTCLNSPSKAVIIHGLKFRSLSQFWIILFHEIAHLLLHISKPGEVFADYEDQKNDEKEQEADDWAYDTLVSVDRHLEFKGSLQKPTIWALKNFADQIKVHPAIAAEIFNRRIGKDVFAYGHLKSKGLFPNISTEQAEALLRTIDRA